MHIDEAVKKAFKEGKDIRRLGAASTILVRYYDVMEVKGSYDYFAPTYDDLTADDWEVVEVDNEGI